MTRRSKRRASLIAASALLAACATVQLPRPTEDDVRRATVARPGASLVQLERGRGLYVSHCTGCHRPVDPRSEPADAWPQHVAEMRKRARLNTDEADLVVLYLVTMSSRPPDQVGVSYGEKGARQP